MFRYLYIVCCFALIVGCSHEHIVLEKFDISNKHKMDTIASYKLQGIFLVNIKDYGYLGDFKNQYVFIKKKDGQNKFAYKVRDKNIEVRLSNKYIAFINAKDRNNYGWFYIKNHQIVPELPKIDSILSHLKMQYPNLFIQEINGYFSIIKNGKVITKNLNYGNFLLNDKKIDFDNLDIGIYKLKNKKLIKSSADGNKLLKENDGLYFVPLPGFNIVIKKELMSFLSEFNSIDNKGDIPDEIEIK